MTRAQLYHTLHRVLQDLHSASESGPYRLLMDVTDLLSPLPKWLEQAEQGQATYDEVAQRLDQRARESGDEAWLAQALEAAASSPGEQEAPPPAEQRAILYHLLFHFFVDVRFAAYQANRVYDARLADLVHNVPLRLRSAGEGHNTDDEILAWVKQRADQNDLSEWLAQVLNDEPPTEAGKAPLPS